MEQLEALVAAEEGRFTSYQSYEELRAHWWNLQREYPQTAHVETWGLTPPSEGEQSPGRPIEALILNSQTEGNRRPYALLQMEHENELPTTLAIQLIADIVCNNPHLLDEWGYNLILANTTHPDGIALQSWAHSSPHTFSPLSYALGFFRSAASEQVAWGYPFRHKKIFKHRPTNAENAANVALIEHYMPTYLHSFHSAALDDAHFFVNNTDATNEKLIRGVISAFQSRGLHLQDGIPEASHYKKVDGYNGVYSPMPGTGFQYESLNNDDELAEEMEWEYGTMAADYMINIDNERLQRTLLTEVPLFTAEALRNKTPSGITYLDALDIVRRNQIGIRKSIETCMPYLTKYSFSSPHRQSSSIGRLYRSVEWFSDLLHQINAQPIQRAGIKDRELSVAESYAMIHRQHYYELLFLGEVHHLAEKLSLKHMSSDLRDEVAGGVESINTVSPMQIIPLPQLVGAQALGGLISLQLSAQAMV